MGAGVGLVGPVAPAGADPVVPIYGDLTGDGIADRVVLGGADCGVTVEPGLGGGGYGPAEVHGFALPPPKDDASPCPDQGAIVDLGGDGVNELLAAWYDGNSCPLGSTEPCPQLLVLRDYEVVQQYFDTNVTSSGLGTADLDADGLVDVYRNQGNDEGFFSMLNTPSGGLVPGPLQHDCGEAYNQLVDLDGNGRLDLVVLIYGWCPGFGGGSSFGHGVGVVLDDGTVTRVTEDEVTDVAWGDVDGDGDLDLVGTNDYLRPGSRVVGRRPRRLHAQVRGQM